MSHRIERRSWGKMSGKCSLFLPDVAALPHLDNLRVEELVDGEDQ